MASTVPKVYARDFTATSMSRNQTISSASAQKPLNAYRTIHTTRDRVGAEGAEKAVEPAEGAEGSSPFAAPERSHPYSASAVTPAATLPTAAIPIAPRIPK